MYVYTRGKQFATQDEGDANAEGKKSLHLCLHTRAWTAWSSKNTQVSA